MLPYKTSGIPGTVVVPVWALVIVGVGVMLKQNEALVRFTSDNSRKVSVKVRLRGAAQKANGDQ